METADRKLEAEISLTMLEAGFKTAPMGGNVMAWRRNIGPDQHVLITCGEDGMDIYGDPEAEEWLVCSYDNDTADCVDGEDVGPMTLAAALETAEAWAGRTA